MDPQTSPDRRLTEPGPFLCPEKVPEESIMPAAGSAGLSRQVVATTRFAFSLKVNVTVASMRRRFGALIFRDIKEVLAMSDVPGL